MFSVRRLGSLMLTGARQKHTLPDLPYEYSALEPVISREIMTLHHTKHHATYVNNLNAAEEKLKEAQSKGDVSTIISLGPTLRFNGGGHINHAIFWQTLSPKSTAASEQFCKAIETDFGSWDNMKNQLAAASVAIQGSGWGWLGYNKQMKRIQIATCMNQDPLQGTTGLIPLFGIDVWEHAYYLQYKNVRPDYVKAIFDIVNWQNVSERYAKALN